MEQWWRTAAPAGLGGGLCRRLFDCSSGTTPWSDGGRRSRARSDTARTVAAAFGRRARLLLLPAAAFRRRARLLLLPSCSGGGSSLDQIGRDPASAGLNPLSFVFRECCDQCSAGRCLGGESRMIIVDAVRPRRIAGGDAHCRRVLRRWRGDGGGRHVVE